MSGKKLEGRVVIVTGGSRGIGAAVVEAASAEGAKVVINYRRDADAAWDLARKMMSAGGEALVVKGDVAKSEECDAVIEQTMEKWGQIDVLVNNAGIIRDNLLATMSDEEWDEVLAVNAGSVHRMCRAVARPMILRKRGRIVNISSVSATKAGRGQTNYAASKGAIEAFTRALAVELAPKGITVNAVAPGIIITDMTKAVREAAEEEAVSKILMKRFGTPDDVARAVMFFASDDASYTTGAILPVDGGFKMG